MSTKRIKRVLCLTLVCAVLMAAAMLPGVSTVSAATSTVMGDADGNGKVNSSDVVRLLYYNLYPNQYSISADCDVNADGKVDSSDSVYLMYHTIFGAASYPLGVTSTGNVTGLTVNGTDISNFKMIRSHLNTSYIAQIEMETMAAGISAKGCSFLIYDDSYTAESKYEIVVGNTGRIGTPVINDQDTYMIKISGSKVYLAGGSPHAVAMAVSEFYKMLLTKGNVCNTDTLTGSYATAIKGYDTSKRYTYKWGDDFSSETIDTTKWGVYGEDTFGREGYNNKWTAMSNDPDYVFNSDGKFHIIGHETNDTYYGGTIVTTNKMHFQYGYVEKSCIVPDGDGFWSLIWLNGVGGGTNELYAPEIDVNECFGAAEKTAINCHAWPTTEGSTQGYNHTSLDAARTKYPESYVTCPDGGKYSDTFHTYGLLWTEDKYEFIFNGKTVMTYNFADVNYNSNGTRFTSELAYDAFSKPYMNIQLSFSVGRLNNGLNISNCTEYEWNNTNRFVVDYVNVYQLDNGKGGMNIF